MFLNCSLTLPLENLAIFPQDSTKAVDPCEDGRSGAALQHSNSFTRATAPDPASFGMILSRPRVYQTPGPGRFPPPGTPTRTPRM